MRDNKGFTVIELFIILAVTSFMTIGIMAFMFYYWQLSYYSQSNLNSFTERLNTSDALRERLSPSSGLITQNGIPDSNTGLEDPDDVSGNYWVPVHAIPTTITAGQDGNVYNPVIYFKTYSTASDGSLIMNGLIPYEDEHILYLNDDGQLKLRTLVNPNTTGTNKELTTCPPSTASSSCPEDLVLINDVASVERRYFSRSGNLIDWTSVYDSDIEQFIGPDNGAVEVVELKVNVSATPTLQQTDSVINSTIIRVALRNT